MHCHIHRQNSHDQHTHNNQTILSGQRNTKTNLWNVTLPTDDENTKTHTDTQHRDSTESAHNVNQTHKTAELVAFAHASFFSLANTTLQQALDKNYVNHFPGLTAQTLRNHPPQSITTVKGHLDQSRKNQRSTQPKGTFTDKQPSIESENHTEDNDNDPVAETDDYWPTSDRDNYRTHQCFAACTEDNTTGKIFTDQTGRFIIPSSTGYTQMFILYDYDSNSIHAEPIKNRSAPEILRAYKIVTTTLTNAGLKPKLQRLDNECSTLLADHMKNKA